MAGPGSSTSNWKPTYDAGKYSIYDSVKLNTPPVAHAAPPPMASWKGINDAAKLDGFRVAGDVPGPTSSHKSYIPTYDAVKMSDTPSYTDGFRVAGDVSGPTSTHKYYNPTEDSGKYTIYDSFKLSDTPSFSDGYRVAGDATASTHKLYTVSDDGYYMIDSDNLPGPEQYITTEAPKMESNSDNWFIQSKEQLYNIQQTRLAGAST